MLTSKQVKRLAIPHEDGEWIDIRIPGWKKLEEAERVLQQAWLANAKLMGGEVMKALPEKQAEADKDPRARYDWGTLLRSAVVAWSYDEKITPQNVEDLDPRTARWLVGEIVQTVTYGEDEQKNS